MNQQRPSFKSNTSELELKPYEKELIMYLRTFVEPFDIIEISVNQTNTQWSILHHKKYRTVIDFIKGKVV